MTSVLNLRRRLFALLFVFAATLIFTGYSAAQNAKDADKIAAGLAPESRAVIERLSGLRELPDGAWKMHAGDLAHGEAVDLDEGDWQTIKPEAKQATMQCGSARPIRCPRR